MENNYSPPWKQQLQKQFPSGGAGFASMKGPFKTNRAGHLGKLLFIWDLAFGKEGREIYWLLFPIPP